MDERALKINPIDEIISNIRALKFSYEIEHTEDGEFFAVVKEFPQAFCQTKNIKDLPRELVKNMREWCEFLSGEFFDWRKGREEQVPYLLKIFLSSDEELLSCLNCVK